MYMYRRCLEIYIVYKWELKTNCVIYMYMYMYQWELKINCAWVPKKGNENKVGSWLGNKRLKKSRERE